MVASKLIAYSLPDTIDYLHVAIQNILDRVLCTRGNTALFLMLRCLENTNERIDPLFPSMCCSMVAASRYNLS